MPFVFMESHLRRLCEINSFSVPDHNMIFFGFRGCLPVNPDDCDFRTEHHLKVVTIDYDHPCCTIAQWLPQDGKIAIFPGSTVPCKKKIQDALSDGGEGANQLMTGFFRDYEKGIHGRNNPQRAHKAFRQTKDRPIRRSGDDLDYDNLDVVEVMNPGDNLHAGWSRGINYNFSSAGCQVVVGFPKCEKPGYEAERGPWKDFRGNAYAIDQDVFAYILLGGYEAQQVALSNSQQTFAFLRFGSFGSLVEELQTALKQKGYYQGPLDGDFGRGTIMAVLKFQEATFGKDDADGIVCPQTAAALGIAWPKI
ncbi:MAG: peptidoglycan-binding domain-containing protein [Desulfobaccales bacterium]|nr:peptidoglycan-binding domain-containing protein [Desulfobaccales bacterium]